MTKCRHKEKWLLRNAKGNKKSDVIDDPLKADVPQQPIDNDPADVLGDPLQAGALDRWCPRQSPES